VKSAKTLSLATINLWGGKREKKEKRGEKVGREIQNTRPIFPFDSMSFSPISFSERKGKKKKKKRGEEGKGEATLE